MSHIQIINDIVTSSNTLKTLNEIEIEFANEISQYNNNEITEIELYEIISIAIDRNNF